MFSKLLFFVQGYSGAANSNIDADDSENGGIKAKFAEGARDVQFGDIYDRTLLFLLSHPALPTPRFCSHWQSPFSLIRLCSLNHAC
jgi:hypothetical protein